MTMTLFTDPNQQGDSLPMTGDMAELPRPFRNRVSSMEATQFSDAGLFFTRTNFRGRVMLARGRGGINSFGASVNGKPGFGNNVASVRVTPVGLRLAVTVVTTEMGGLPGGTSNMGAFTTWLEQVVDRANSFLEIAMIRLTLAEVRLRPSAKYFDMNLEYATFLFNTFNVRDHVNVYLVNTLRNASGISVPACLGNKIVMDFRTDLFAAGNTLAHEVGHFLGLGHASALGDDGNLMTGSANFGPNLRIDQMEAMHEKIASGGRAFEARLV